ncbi:hypothetical protein TWF718_005026 [Orbilia javanica]|uniref:Uncharacterized protein n=1 Tax=Orbilia javanica TaxID=47235 RepID=A0AAN8RFZ7_9PEZI
MSFGRLKAKYDTNPGPGKVGIIMPAFSSEVLWFSGIPGMQSAIEIVMAENRFIDETRLSFRVNGDRATRTHQIHPGDIIEIDGTTAHPFEQRKLDELVAERKRELEPSTSDEDEPIFDSQEDGVQGTPPPNSDGIGGRWRPWRYTPLRYRSNKRVDTGDRSRPRSPPYQEIYMARTANDGASARPPTNRPTAKSFASRVGPKISELTKSQRRQLIRTPKTTTARFRNRRKVKLRFHLMDFGEPPMEILATNYEPLHVHFNVVRRRLVRCRIIDRGDELNFIWPHLRWIPCGNTRVHAIRMDGRIDTYACFVSKRGVETGNLDERDNKVYDRAREDSIDYHDEEEEEEGQYQHNQQPSAKNQIIETRLPEEWNAGNDQVDPNPATEEDMILWGHGRDGNNNNHNTNRTQRDGRNASYEYQEDLISFSDAGSPFPDTVARSVSELSTIGHDEVETDEWCRAMPIPTYVTNDGQYGGNDDMSISEW